MTDPATECLPPDPATPGLWWLSTPDAPVMRAWHPASRSWADTDGGRTAACSAHAAGWRVWVAAVPPGETPSPDHLAQRMAEITSDEGLKTMTQGNPFLALMVGK